jgi:hypothetical protein
MMMDTLENEIAHRLSQGYRQVSFEQFKTECAAIGYTFDRTSDVRSIARYMTGERAGQSYPYLGLYPVQMDNKVSAWNVNARRDANYEAFKVLRNSVFAVSRGRIVEV